MDTGGDCLLAIKARDFAGSSDASLLVLHMALT